MYQNKFILSKSHRYDHTWDTQGQELLKTGHIVVLKLYPFTLATGTRRVGICVMNTSSIYLLTVILIFFLYLQQNRNALPN